MKITYQKEYKEVEWWKLMKLLVLVRRSGGRRSGSLAGVVVAGGAGGGGGGERDEEEWRLGFWWREVKKGNEMKRKSLYRFWICEGDANKIEERGVFVKWGGEVVLLANLGRPWWGVRWSGSVWKLVRWRYFGGGKWKNGEGWKIWWKEKEGKKKEKGKEIHMRRYFHGRGDENNRSGGFPGLSRGCGNLSGKYRNRPKFKYLGTTRKNSQKSRILF